MYTKICNYVYKVLMKTVSKLPKTSNTRVSWILTETLNTLNDVKWMLLNGFSLTRKFNAKNIYTKLCIAGMEFCKCYFRANGCTIFHAKRLSFHLPLYFRSARLACEATFILPSPQLQRLNFHAKWVSSYYPLHLGADKSRV